MGDILNRNFESQQENRHFKWKIFYNDKQIGKTFDNCVDMFNSYKVMKKSLNAASRCLLTWRLEDSNGFQY